VCEEPIRRKNERQRFGSGHKTCEQEYRRFPHVYDPPKRKKPLDPVRCTTGSRSAHSTGLKIGIEGHPPTAHCLRDWWWGGDRDRDHSLYDRDGLTIARIVLGDDSRYHRRSPVTWQRMSWPDLGEAKRRAMSMALAGIPLAASDPKLAARIKRDNETPHPMGPPLNRPPLTSDATSSDWRPTGNGAGVLNIPPFLQRAARNKRDKVTGGRPVTGRRAS
jgi:hypothetical protein